MLSWRRTQQIPDATRESIAWHFVFSPPVRSCNDPPTTKPPPETNCRGLQSRTVFLLSGHVDTNLLSGFYCSSSAVFCRFCCSLPTLLDWCLKRRDSHWQGTWKTADLFACLTSGVYSQPALVSWLNQWLLLLLSWLIGLIGLERDCGQSCSAEWRMFGCHNSLAADWAIKVIFSRLQLK